MPRLNHRALMCELSETKTTKDLKKKKKSKCIPVVKDGAKREGVGL